MNKGFTLVEILVAVMIVVILVTMAAPMYDKAIEKSRIAEARVTAKKLWDAKARLLDVMDKDTYNSSLFGIQNMDFAMPCKSVTNTTCNTDDFMFSINPGGNAALAVVNGVCVKRLKGDHKDTLFLYVGEDVSSEEEANYGRFWCKETSSGACDAYAMKNKTGGIQTWTCN